MTTPSERIAAEIGPASPYRWLSSTDVRRMIDAGILDEDSRVELIGGILLAREPQTPYHCGPIQVLTAHFARGLDPSRHILRVQLPVVVDDYSEPEPDLAVVTAEEAFDMTSHPRRPLLLVEVSQARLRFDRSAKLRLYAAANFPEYWVVDVAHRQVLVHREPDPASATYRQERVFVAGESVSPALLQVPPVDVRALFR